MYIGILQLHEPYQSGGVTMVSEKYPQLKYDAPTERVYILLSARETVDVTEQYKSIEAQRRGDEQ